MEKIRDLLDPTKSNLQVGEDETNGVYIKGASEKYVGSAAETYDIMKEVSGCMHRYSRSFVKETRPLSPETG